MDYKRAKREDFIDMEIDSVEPVFVDDNLKEVRMITKDLREMVIGSDYGIHVRIEADRTAERFLLTGKAAGAEVHQLYDDEFDAKRAARELSALSIVEDLKLVKLEVKLHADNTVMGYDVGDGTEVDF